MAYESIQGMERAYRQGTVYALALVALISAVMLRRLRETAIATQAVIVSPAFDSNFAVAHFRLAVAANWAAQINLKIDLLAILDAQVQQAPFLFGRRPSAGSTCPD